MVRLCMVVLILTATICRGSAPERVARGETVLFAAPVLKPFQFYAITSGGSEIPLDGRIDGKTLVWIAGRPEPGVKTIMLDGEYTIVVRGIAEKGLGSRIPIILGNLMDPEMEAKRQAWNDELSLRTELLEKRIRAAEKIVEQGVPRSAHRKKELEALWSETQSAWEKLEEIIKSHTYQKWIWSDQDDLIKGNRQRLLRLHHQVSEILSTP